ncbi:hypothetical protein BDV06DRAFT_132861 [Aspergillus oleicola]
MEMNGDVGASPGSKENGNENSNLENIHLEQQHNTLPPTSEAQSGDFPIPFDMLGFIGEITSDFQQKHLDLTNGGTVASATAMPVPLSEVDSDLHNERQIPWSSATGEVENIGILSEPSDPSRRPTGDLSELYEEELLEYFRKSKPPPTIFAPVDLEWPYVRDVMLSESSNCRALLLSIYCYADMHKAWIDGTTWNMGPTYHAQASSEIQTLLVEDISEGLLKRVFISVLLLMLAELISRENWRPPTPFLQTAYLLIQRFHERTGAWMGLAHLVSSWVELLDIKSLIAGREGDTLTDLGILNTASNFETTSKDPVINITSTTTSNPSAPGLPDQDTPDDLPPPPPTYHLTQTITSPAYTFFLATQQLTRRIITIDLHHRSRGTVSDEFEVLQIAHTVSADLESLWNSRPRILDLYTSSPAEEGELCEVLAPTTARNVVRTFRSYVVNFLALFVYLHRVAFAIYPRTDRVNRAVERIMVLAKEETSPISKTTTGGDGETGKEAEPVPTSFIWPLFIAALEGSLEQRRWITAKMQRMADLAPGRGRSQRHPNVSKALVLLEEMTRRQDASRTWADSRCVRRELFVDFFVMI